MLINIHESWKGKQPDTLIRIYSLLDETARTVLSVQFPKFRFFLFLLFLMLPEIFFFNVVVFCSFFCFAVIFNKRKKRKRKIKTKKGE